MEHPDKQLKAKSEGQGMENMWSKERVAEWYATLFMGYVLSL